MPNNKTTPASGNVIILAVCVVFVVTLGAAVAVTSAVEDGARASSLVSMILPVGGTALLALLALFKIGEVQQVAEEVRAHTVDLTNGKMDAKIRAGVADVLADALIDPQAYPLVEQAREIRDRGNAETHAEAIRSGRDQI